MAGGRRRVIECAAWRRKRETERREREKERGRGGLPCVKKQGEKGEEKERSRQAGEEVQGWR